MTFITTMLRPSMVIRQNHSPTLTLSHMKLRPKIFTKINPDIEKRFNTSDYPTNHPSGIKTGLNSKVLAMFKDEASGKQIVEFVCWRAKLYSCKMLDGSEYKKCKGVTKNVTKRSIQFDDYRECLFNRKEQHQEISVIRSHCHEIYTEEINKIALSSDDDKRVIMADGIHTLAYRHTNLKHCTFY